MNIEKILKEYTILVERRCSLSEYFTESEDRQLEELEKTIISKVEELKLKNDFLCLQLNYEYGNLEDDYFISESKKYISKINNKKHISKRPKPKLKDPGYSH